MREYVQCCHGGIELGYSNLVRTFLMKPLPPGRQRDMCTLPDPSLVGLNWSDFTGLLHTQEGDRGSGSVSVGLHDTRRYLKHTGVGAIFRGHQDMVSSFKLLRPRCRQPVEWFRHIEHWPSSAIKENVVSLMLADSTRGDWKQTTPVFTLSTARDVRHVSEDGFCILYLNGSARKDWALICVMLPDPSPIRPHREMDRYNMSSVRAWANSWRASAHRASTSVLQVVKELNRKMQTPGHTYSSTRERGFILKACVPRDTRLFLCGDIHGCQESLINVLLHWLELDAVDNDTWRLAPSVRAIFLGDLVDRGTYSAEVCMTVMKLHAVNPNRCFVVRGNHEVHMDGLYTDADDDSSLHSELRQRFPSVHRELEAEFTSYFATLPDAVFFGVADI